MSKIIPIPKKLSETESTESEKKAISIGRKEIEEAKYATLNDLKNELGRQRQ